MGVTTCGQSAAWRTTTTYGQSSAWRTTTIYGQTATWRTTTIYGQSAAWRTTTTYGEGSSLCSSSKGTGAVGGGVTGSAVFAYRCEIHDAAMHAKCMAAEWSEFANSRAATAIKAVKATAFAKHHQPQAAVIDYVQSMKQRAVEKYMLARAEAARALVVGKTKASEFSAGAKAVASDPCFPATAASAAAGGVVCGAGGGALGFTTGGMVGAAVGIVPSIFTLGLSIPAGAVIGASFGLGFGLAAGASAGFTAGGVLGWGIHSCSRDAKSDHAVHAMSDELVETDCHSHDAMSDQAVHALSVAMFEPDCRSRDSRDSMSGPAFHGLSEALAQEFGSRAWKTLRQCHLRVDEDNGAGLDLDATRHGYVIDGIHDAPGQHGLLQPGDVIMAIGDVVLFGMDELQMCRAFLQHGVDGARLVVVSTSELEAA